MSGRSCDMCGESLAAYFAGANRCDNCADNYGLEFDVEPHNIEPLQSDSLFDCLQDIAHGLGDTLN